MHVLNGQKMQMRKEACRTFCCICHAPTLCQCDCTGSDNPDLSLCTTLKVTLYLVCKCKNGVMWQTISQHRPVLLHLVVCTFWILYRSNKWNVICWFVSFNIVATQQHINRAAAAAPVLHLCLHGRCSGKVLSCRLPMLWQHRTQHTVTVVMCVKWKNIQLKYENMLPVRLCHYVPGVDSRIV